MSQQQRQVKQKYSPLKRVKQSSLSQFYRKVDFNSQINPITYNPSNIQLTPSKPLFQQIDKNNLSSILVPSYIGENYKNLDVDSNVKPREQQGNIQNYRIQEKPREEQRKIQSYRIQKKQINYFDEFKPTDKNFHQNLFSKLSNPSSYQPQSYQPHPYQSLQHNSLLQQPDFYQISPKKYNKEYSEIDYSLSIEQQEIRVPTDKRLDYGMQQFKYGDQRLDSNFLITPENSILQSPSNIRWQKQQNNFTPQMIKNEEKEPPASEVIQRLRFNTEQVETTQDQLQQVINNIKKQQTKNNATQLFEKPSQQFGKVKQQFSKVKQQLSKVKQQVEKPAAQQSFSPSSYFRHESNIPSPNKIPKRSPSIQKSAQPHKKSDKKQILSSDDEDSSQLLTKIRQLQSQVSQLKTHKYEFAINTYRQQTKFQLQRQLEISVKQINLKYDQQQQTLKKQTELQLNLFNKSIEDIAKYKKTYAIIMNQLKENKDKIEEEYKQKVQEVRKFKERLIHEWKRNSNEEIKKIINNTHVKHSIKLPDSKDKPTRVNSKQKITHISKQKQSPLNFTK